VPHFLGIVAPTIRDRAVAAAACAAGITAVLAWPLPLRLGLLLAVAAGIAAGMLVETCVQETAQMNRLLAADPGARALQFHSARLLHHAVRALDGARAGAARSALRPGGGILRPSWFPSWCLTPARCTRSGQPRLLAGILGGAIAWRTRNTLLTIVAGIAGAAFVRLSGAVSAAVSAIKLDRYRFVDRDGKHRHMAHAQ